MHVHLRHGISRLVWAPVERGEFPDRSTSLVTVTIGGNNLKLGGVLSTYPAVSPGYCGTAGNMTAGPSPAGAAHDVT